MKSGNRLSSLAVAVLLGGLALSAHAGLVFDRGLPDANLNNAAGSSRSNVAWDFNPSTAYVAGDDFRLAPVDPGQKHWVIDRIRVWTTAGAPGSGFQLGDRFQQVSLFVGRDGATGTPISRVATASVTGNTTDNANVSITPVQYAGGADYQGSSGSMVGLWQIDFDNLGVFDAGLYMFGVDGIGTAGANWFNHASNAALSGTPQDGADNLGRWFEGNAGDGQLVFGDSWDSNGFGWDKSSDINIQVFAHQVPEPSSVALLALGLAGLLRRRPRPV